MHRLALVLLLFSKMVSAMPAADAWDNGERGLVASKRVCPGSVATGGVDVSSFNVGNDWRALVRTGRGFAFVKATEGLSLANPRFATDWAGSRAAGLVRGAYHFFRADRDPVQAAQFFLKTMGSLGRGDLPPVLDWEISANRTPTEQVVAALAWLNTVEKATGRVPIIYTSPAFFNSIGNPKQFARYPLFVANYDVSCPSVPAPWTTWTFWQYSSTATVPGIAGSAVDEDLYNGSWAQLNQLAR